MVIGCNEKVVFCCEVDSNEKVMLHDIRLC